MKKIIAFAFITSLFINCSSNDMDDAKLEEEIPVLPVTILNKHERSGIMKQTFTYDGAKISEINYTNPQDPKDTYGLKEVYQYNGDNIIGIKTYNKSGKMTSTSDWTYKNGKLASYTGKTIDQIINNEPKTITFNSTYTWVTDNHLKISYINSNNNLPETEEIFFTNGELTSYVRLGTKFVFTYDTNNNPFKNIKGWMTLNLLSATNIVKQENINLLGSDNAYFTYTHEYNTNKYPTKTINTQHYDGTTKIVNTTEYTYNK